MVTAGGAAIGASLGGRGDRGALGGRRCQGPGLRRPGRGSPGSPPRGSGSGRRRSRHALAPPAVSRPGPTSESRSPSSSSRRTVSRSSTPIGSASRNRASSAAGIRRSGDRPSASPTDDHPERFAPACGAGELHEGEVVAAGEDADPLGGDDSGRRRRSRPRSRTEACDRADPSADSLLPRPPIAPCRVLVATDTPRGYHASARRPDERRCRTSDKEASRATGRRPHGEPSRRRTTSATATPRTRPA